MIGSPPNASRAPARQAITEGRDAVQGLRSSTTISNDLARAIHTVGEGLAADQTGGNRPQVVSTWKAHRGISLQYFGTKFTGLPAKRYGMHSDTQAPGGSKWRST